MRIDSHHHLWRYSADQYDWIDDRMSVLRRDFLCEDLSNLLPSANVKATVAVQARQSCEETNWLLEEASRCVTIRGVVGWAPISDPGLGDWLEKACTNPLLSGLRHVVQSEPSGFLDRGDFNEGIRQLLQTGLTYDLLVFPGQIEEATRFVDRHERQQFVLDHIAKPAIASGGLASWSKGFRELARRPNLVCKLSGMVTEADWKLWKSSDLKPYLDVALEAFGPTRLMCGSDWPVLTLAATYSQWWDVLSEWLAPLSASEKAQIEGGVAAQIYQLDLTPIREAAA